MKMRSRSTLTRSLCLPAVAVACVFVAVLWLRPVAAQSLDADLQRAIQSEVTTGDLKAAIAAYTGIVARAGANRAVAVQALLRLAQCHQKLGDAESRRIYERVIKDFADQPSAVAEARARLLNGGPASALASGRTARQLWVGPGVDASGSPSSDGRYLSATDWGTGDLVIRDLASATSRRLTNTGGWETSADFAESSVLSPDARSVAYAWFTDKATNNFYDLRLLPTGPGEPAKPRIIHPADSIEWIRPWAWMPDGKSLIVQRQFTDGGTDKSGDIAIISTAGGAVRTLRKLEWQNPVKISLSPDGKWLAFDLNASETNPARDIFLLSIDSGREVALVRHPANDSHPMWSPDGARLLFMSDRSGADALWSLRVSDGSSPEPAELISADVGRQPIAVTRNGTLLYQRSRGGRNVHQADLGPDLTVKGPPTLVSERFMNSNSGAVWSPDGESVAYYSGRGSVDAIGSTVLVIRSMKTGEERDIIVRLRVPPLQQTAPRWFPDGRSFLVVGRNLRGGVTYYRLDPSTGNLQVLRAVTDAMGVGLHQPQISPDGTYIVHIQRKGVLVRFDIQSGRETPLTDRVLSFALSSDGSQVAYLANANADNPRASRIGVMPTTGGSGRTLYESPRWYDSSRFNSLGWSPDGRHVLFVREDEASGQQALWQVPTGGGAAERTGIQVAGRLKAPSVHPNGQKLLYSTLDEAPNEIWALENFLATGRGQR